MRTLLQLITEENNAGITVEKIEGRIKRVHEELDAVHKIPIDCTSKQSDIETLNAELRRYANEHHAAIANWNECRHNLARYLKQLENDFASSF